MSHDKPPALNRAMHAVLVLYPPTLLHCRGDVHVLLVGDPGLGKSQLLQAAAGAAPRGLYICGNTSTGGWCEKPVLAAG